MRQGQITGLTSGDVDVMVWRDTNRVAMISTYHGNGQQTTRGSTKSILILDYNIMMGGVDKKDQLLAMNPVERKRTKVWGKRLLLRAGHKYNEKRNNKDGTTTWYYIKRTTCKAVLVTFTDNSIKREDIHNCEPDFASNELEIQLGKCIDKITSDYTIPVPSAYRETVSKLKDSGINLIKKIPDLVNVKNKLYKKRNKSLDVPKVCFKSPSEIIVPEKLKKKLLADYYYKSNRILVFANENCRTVLSRSNLTILCDGTFKCCLRPFQQLYTVHVDLESNEMYNNIMPVVYALLPNKTKNIYNTLFNLIKSQIPQFNPKLFVLDFEQAAMSAITETFPETQISDCHFHFSKSLWQRAENLGLTKFKLARKHIKRRSVLAHLPKEDVESGWLYIMSQCPRTPNKVSFNDYFIETWLSEESFFFQKIPAKPKSIAQFLTILQKEDDYFNVLYQKGSNITKKLKETQEIDENIYTTINEYKQGKINVDLCIERLVL
ncbi:hypothetical protein HF086_000411 [Spodoptera exigua]|uniref:MULE transposase domain-containing protein n=1 Tax=Spodoptera exigua TaxID=7107 RepID=A0A922MAH8_SPOEX|nr:hypothetical protein HF086_000411 [Spodoptera exigua]